VFKSILGMPTFHQGDEPDEMEYKILSYSRPFLLYYATCWRGGEGERRELWVRGRSGRN